MMRIIKLIAAVLITLSITMTGYAGPLDDFYLRQFREIIPSPTDPVTKPQRPICGMPLKRDLKRDWNKLEPATQTVLAKQFNAPPVPNEGTISSTAGHFIVHYSTSGSNAPAPGFPYTATSWARQVGDTFEQVYSAYQSTYGYRPPPGNQYHIYLNSLAAQYMYGVTTTSTPAPSAGFKYAYSSFIEIDKDFTSPIFTDYPTATYTPLQSLQVTAAHEFQHAIQFGYNVFSEAWYAEATATWFEALMYPTIMQNYSFVPAYFTNSQKRLDLTVDANSMDTGAGYGRWIFNRYLAEQYSPSLIRTVWENMATIDPPDLQSDIQMLPVVSSAIQNQNGNMANDFLGFAKRVYLQNEWQLSEDRLNSHLVYVPVSPAYTRYPVNNTSSPRPFQYLERLSFKYYKLVPVNNMLNDGMAITVNATSAVAARIFRKDLNTGSITEIAVANTYPASGNVPVVSGASEIVLLLVNTSSNTVQNANFSTDGSFIANAPVTNGDVPPEPNTSSFAKGAGGGGCFIATAAFGSYLHPQVQVLRDFRDNWLLSNAPGRAFVNIYYRVSPPIAEYISKHDKVRLAVRIMLAPVVFAVGNAILVFLIVITCSLVWFIRRLCTKTFQGQLQVDKQ